MSKVRNLFWIVMCLLAFPALARAETTACDLLTKADVQEIIGMQVTETRSRSLELCAGFCETTTGTGCMYIGTLAGAQHVAYLAVELPPYFKRDMVGFARAFMKSEADSGAQTAEMVVVGQPAFWGFSPKNQSQLHILDGDEVHFLIIEQGPGVAAENDIALQHAQAMAARVYDRYKAQ